MTHIYQQYHEKQKHRYMTQEQQQQIRDALMRYTASFSGMQEAAKQLNGVSISTITKVINNNWETITEQMWRRIARQVGFYTTAGKQPVDTSAHQLLRILLGDAQRNAMIYGITLDAGMGKTFTAKNFAAEHTHAHYITCADHFTRKTFLSEILHSMGKESTGTLPTMMDDVITCLEEQDEPLLILDEADRLNEPVLQFFITLYNKLAGQCGIVIMATEHLKKRIETGVRLKKKGYSEIYSRIGRRFVEIRKLNGKDIELVCRANGVTDDITITRICNESKGDLRYVTQLLHNHTHAA